MAVLGEYPWGDQVVLPAGRTPVTSGNPHKGNGYIVRTGKGVYKSMLTDGHFTDSLPAPPLQTHSRLVTDSPLRQRQTEPTQIQAVYTQNQLDLPGIELDKVSQRLATRLASLLG